MADEKAKKVTYLKMPSFTRFLIGGLIAWWLSSIMNPAFVAIAVLMILIIPILTVDNIFSKQFERAYQQPEEVQPKKMSKSEYQAALEAEAAKKQELEAAEAAKSKGKKTRK
ncbi:MAG: hypothetical protein PHQ03_09935 [Methylococcales bacterium]|nr:hypothetical protein [Methylococcales bacterium]